MASKPIMIAINWFGPYKTLKAARTAARSDYAEGLYLALGKRRGGCSEMSYIGISNDLGTRLANGHHALGSIPISQIWLGEVATAEPSGKKVKVTKASLDYSEWLHACFLELSYNDRKTLNAPKRSVTVLNRWWKTDYVTPRRNRPHPDWPDLLDHPMEGRSSRMVWFGRKQVLVDV